MGNIRVFREDFPGEGASKDHSGSGDLFQWGQRLREGGGGGKWQEEGTRSNVDASRAGGEEERLLRPRAAGR